MNKRKTINTRSTYGNIDLYRIENAIKMMDEIIGFIKLEKSGINIDKIYIEVFEYKIKIIENSIARLHTNVDDFKKNIF